MFRDDSQANSFKGARRLSQLGADMHRWQLRTTRQGWTMVSVVSGAIVVGLVKLVFVP